MRKLGAYGFLRFTLPIAPNASHSLAGMMIALSLIAVIYIGLVAIVQDDMKKLVAYSSVAHMGFVTLGFFIFNTAGVEGAIVQMISHSFVSGAMRSEEHTSELQSLMRISYAVFCLTTKNSNTNHN